MVSHRRRFFNSVRPRSHERMTYTTCAVFWSIRGWCLGATLLWLPVQAQEELAFVSKPESARNLDFICLKLNLS